MAVTDTTFQYQAATDLRVAPALPADYQFVSGVGYLTIDGPEIELADLDESEFGAPNFASAVTNGRIAAPGVSPLKCDL
jgi:hypothetical protein